MKAFLSDTSVLQMQWTNMLPDDMQLIIFSHVNDDVNIEIQDDAQLK